MTTFDLIGALGLTASAAVIAGGLAASRAISAEMGARLVAVLAAWFVIVVAAGASGVFTVERGLGTPGIGFAVALPIVIAMVIAARVPTFAEAVRALPVELLIALQGVRVLGIFFVLLYAAGRLPAPFAPIAGWGDVIAGVSALPVAWLVTRRAPGWRRAALLWNAYGLLDLVVAIELGVTSAAGSPFRVFVAGPNTDIMSGLPWILIPAFLVPLLALGHLAVFWRLRAAGRAACAAHA